MRRVLWVGLALGCSRTDLGEPDPAAYPSDPPEVSSSASSASGSTTMSVSVGAGGSQGVGGAGAGPPDGLGCGVVWSRSFGGPEHQYGTAVALGTASVAIVGSFRQTVDFGGGALVSAGGDYSGDAFVAKFTDGGDHVWSRRFGTWRDEEAFDVAVAPADAVVMTGQYRSGSEPIDLGGGPVEGSDVYFNLFVLKLDAAGQHVWSRGFGTGALWESLAVDATGNVVLAGTSFTNVDFGGGPLLYEGFGDVYVAKLDPSGAHVWSRRFGSAEEQRCTDVGIDGEGQVVITGYFLGTIDFGGGPMTSNDGQYSAFLAAFDTQGVHVWSRHYPRALGRSLAVDPAGQVVVSGEFADVIDLGEGPITLDGGGEFVARLDAGGQLLWARAIGGPKRGNSSVGASTDRTVVVGARWGDVDLGGGLVKCWHGHADPFAVSYDAAGEHVCGRCYGSSVSLFPLGVAVGDQRAFVIGGFEGTADFGVGALQTAGESDIFLMRLSP